jgi:hypothetical protein
MMKKEFKPLSWKCKNFDCNRQVIEDYDVLKYRENEIKKLKKKCATKEEFAKKLRSELMYHFWSRAQYELIIELTEKGGVLLKPWCGCYDNQKATIDVTNDTTFDWKGFAEEHIGKQRYKNEAKVDIYDQLTYGDQFEKFVTYLWTTRLKYERDDPKFHR